MKFILGFLVIGIGVFMVVKTEWMVENFGRSAWAEEKFVTSGGTRLLYKLIGIVAIFLTFMVWTGGFQRLLLGTFGSLFGL